ncbi:MAG: hypothetical protein J6K39_01400 [Clostridia bacterium]|nr:hypothetical protein [Clostridia bacterium]
MKRKIAALLLVLIMCVSVFTGCSLWERDDKAFYESVAGRVTYTDGQVDEITNRELIMAYRSYGYNYVDNYGYTVEQALEVTLGTVVDNKVKIKDVKECYEEKNEALFNDREKTYLWNTTFDSLYSNLTEYYNNILGLKSSDESNSSEQTNSSVYEEYDRQTSFATKDGKLVIKLNNPETTVRDSYDISAGTRDYEAKSDGGVQLDKEAMYNKLYALVGNKTTKAEKDWGNAFKNYIDTIKENYSYMTFTTDKDCFMFEMDRVYNILKDNYLVQKYSEIYTNQTGLSPVTVDEVLKSYSEKVRADYTKYYSQKDSTYETNMISDSANMDYVLTDGEATFFNVGYIKMEFTDAQKADLAELKAKNEAGSINDYDAQVDALYAAVVANIRDAETGEKTGNTISATNLRTEIETVVSGAGANAATEQEKTYAKADAFRKYLYLYNDDDTMKGAETATMFGIKKDGSVLANETFSGKTDIEAAIKELYSNGTAEVGKLSTLVRAEDGIYLFFYAGEVENLFSVTKDFDVSTEENNVKTLASTRINIFSNKTIFDKLYEELTSSYSSIFESLHIEYLKSAEANLVSKIEMMTDKIADVAEAIG